MDEADEPLDVDQLREKFKDAQRLPLETQADIVAAAADLLETVHAI